MSEKTDRRVSDQTQRRCRWAAKQVAAGNCRDCGKKRDRDGVRCKGCNTRSLAYGARCRRKMGQKLWQPGKPGRPPKGDK